MEWDLPVMKNLWEKETRTLVAEQRSESNPSDEFGDSEDKENETDKVARNADYMSIPKEKLNKSQKKAESLIKAKKNCQANQELIRCVTFSRIVFGTEHWRYAQALTNLAYGYLTLRELPVQAKQHAESAKNSLLTWKGSAISDADKKEILGTLVTLYYTLGMSDLMQNHGKEAYYNLQKSEKSMEELWECHDGAAVRDLKVSEKDLIIALGRAALQLHRLNLSVNYFEKAITHVISSKGDSASELISLYQEAAQVEQLRKNHDRAIEHLLQAHSICVASYKELSAEAAKTGFLLAKAYATSGEPQHRDAAELYFTSSLKAYQASLGPDNYHTMCATEEFSKWLLQIGEKQEAYKLLKNSLKSQLMSYGDYSEKVAETFYILGSICLAKGEIKKTTQLLRKCLEIQILIYGTDHKKTRETQKLLTLLQRLKMTSLRNTTSTFHGISPVPSRSSGIIEKENRQERQK
ncbi:tetratricopeptide repeat protein 23-like [Trichosurus vulpecula]|uniref:tetratricopeptide repeat protein 23-like n=1 Tax=Trichosurus vulpecula TaxID=9337 RepID=UPI00186B4FE9|nr:tetratricopeptide repeat protein 23-like [Trichosurus vulpecula]